MLKGTDRGYNLKMAEEDVLCVEDNDVSVSSSSSEDIRPQVRLQFEKLAGVLRETNQNLHTFEFMLNQYRQLAKIAPFAVRPDGTSDRDDPIMEQLKLLATSVDRIRPESSGNDEVQREIKVLRKQVESLSGNSAKVQDLEAKLNNKTADCQTYLLANQRLELELAEEKKRRLVLDQKLDSERRAAKIVAQDITRYVDAMKQLEKQVEHYKNLAETDDKNSTTLCRSCLESSTIEEAALRVRVETSELAQELVVERQRRLEIEQKHSSCESQIQDYEIQLKDLKLGLETVQDELERCQSSTGDQNLKRTQLKLANVKAERNVLFASESKANEEATQAKFKLQLAEEALDRLKAKSKILLSKYRSRKQSFSAMSNKVNKIRTSLIQLQSLCRTKEENNRRILDHLGNQIEISARLLAAYLKVSIEDDLVKDSKKTLAAWFCDVQALASWTHSQLAAFGARYWMGKEEWKREDEDNTISELSEMLSKDSTAQNPFDTILSLIDE